MTGIESTAEERIRQHRTGNFRLRLRDADGAALPNARAAVRLLRHEFRLGANGFLLRSTPPAGSEPRQVSGCALSAEYEHAFANLMNYATLPFYWGRYEPEAEREQTEQLRRMAVWCQDHNIRPKGHPLAWHEVVPPWAQGMPDEEVLRRLRERIGRIVGAFSGLVDTWDVINEATVSANYDNAVGRWIKACGALSAVAETLSLARSANPNSELLYNDFNISPTMEELLGGLRERGAAFDAVGIQSHMHKGAWTAEKVWQTCETYARFGLPLHFTEATILSGRLKADGDNDWHRRQTDWPTTPDGEARQLEEGRRFYTLLFSHPAVESITWWDFSDSASWQGAPSGLLRKDMSPKPLAEWLRKAFYETWTTRLAAASDAKSEIGFQGFFGLYSIRAETSSGATLAGSCRLSRRGPREVEAVLTQD